MMSVLFLAILTSQLGISTAHGMRVLYSWSKIDFLFDTEADRQRNISSGNFIPENCLINDVDYWKGDGEEKIIVTLPMFAEGIPATVATVTNQTRNGTTLLKPYPDWSWQGKCEGMYSVYRMKIDKCNRIWMIDGGLFQDSKRMCNPKILIFDLKTNTLIRIHHFPSNILQCNSNLITITVEVRGGNCSESWAYVADVAGYNLMVYYYLTDSSWVVKNKCFYPDPKYGYVTINGTTLELIDGLYGVTLGPEHKNKRRKLYCHSFAEVHECSVDTHIIRDKSAFVNHSAAFQESFHVSKGTRQSQSTVEDMTQSGILIYALVAENAIGCWNSKMPFNKHNVDIVAKNDDTMQYISGLKVINDTVWCVSNRIQNYINSKVPTDQDNYRILVGKVNDLVSNTRCVARPIPWFLPC